MPGKDELEEYKEKNKEMLSKLGDDIVKYKAEIKDYEEKLLKATKKTASDATETLLEKTKNALKAAEEKAAELRKNMR